MKCNFCNSNEEMTRFDNWKSTNDRDEPHYTHRCENCYHEEDEDD